MKLLRLVHFTKHKLFEELSINNLVSYCIFIALQFEIRILSHFDKLVKIKRTNYKSEGR